MSLELKPLAFTVQDFCSEARDPEVDTLNYGQVAKKKNEYHTFNLTFTVQKFNCLLQNQVQIF